MPRMWSQSQWFLQWPHARTCIRHQNYRCPCFATCGSLYDSFLHAKTGKNCPMCTSQPTKKCKPYPVSVESDSGAGTYLQLLVQAARGCHSVTSFRASRTSTSHTCSLGLHDYVVSSGAQECLPAAASHLSGTSCLQEAASTPDGEPPRQ